MPVVQRYGERKVSTEALPGARLQSALTPTAAGAGLAEAQGNIGDAIGRVGAVGMHVAGGLLAMQEEERRKADDFAHLKATNALDKATNQMLYDPEHGALLKKGEAAMPTPEAVGTEARNAADEIGKTLTPRQRDLFEKSTLVRLSTVDATLRRHVAGEMMTMRAEELQAKVELQHSAAIANAQDPRMVGIALQDGIDAIKKTAPELGHGPKQVEQEIAKFQTSVHVGVIDNLLANEKTAAAKIYYEEVVAAGQISGEAQARIVKALEISGDRTEAQTQTAAILAKGGTLAEQRALAKTIDKSEVQDDVLRRLEHENGLKQQLEQQAESSRLDAAFNTLDATRGDLSKIPASDWQQLGRHQPALKAEARRIAKGDPKETDLATWQALERQMYEDPAGFAKQPLLAYAHKLDDGDMKRFIGVQASLLKGEKPAEIETVRTRNMVVDDTLSTWGINPKPKEGTPEDQSLAQLRRMIDVRVAEVETVPGHVGKKVNGLELQEIVDHVMSQSQKTPGSWWQLGFGATDTHLFNLKITDVPAADRTQIIQYLNSRQKPVNDATILNYYIERQSRK